MFTVTKNHNAKAAFTLHVMRTAGVSSVQTLLRSYRVIWEADTARRDFKNLKFGEVDDVRQPIRDLASAT